MAKNPGEFFKFNGLWVRGPVEKTPPDHFSDCSNVMFALASGERANVVSRDGTSSYSSLVGVKRMALYKPLPPYTGTNIPRIIALAGTSLYDILISTSVPIYTNASMTDFSLANFFGRCYISPSNGTTGLSGVNVQVYSGSGTTRDAGGAAPTTLHAAAWNGALTGFWDPGTWLVSYALETASGFITQPRSPFIGLESFGAGGVDFTIPVGPAGTVARWIIMTKSFPLGGIGPLGGPWEVQRALTTPLYFVQRVGDNVTTAVQVLNMLDEQLIEDASYLPSQLVTIPAGVGLYSYKGKMVVYGAAADPSLIRVSVPGEPEAFSATSGFIITDPADSSGVRDMVEFNDNLYYFKKNRGSITQDNGLPASTWTTSNFEKAIGCSTHGIAQVLDAEGSSADGFLIASKGGIYYFNGGFVEPEITYKIRDYWLTVTFIHQLMNDPVNKRLYCIVTVPTAVPPIVEKKIIFGDYRDGLDPFRIKWSLWSFQDSCTCGLTYLDFAGGVAEPSIQTRLGQDSRITSLTIGTPGQDAGALGITSSFITAPVRFATGISQFDRLRVNAFGPSLLNLSLIGKNAVASQSLGSITIPTHLPAREYALYANFISEIARVQVTCSGTDVYIFLNDLLLEGFPYSDERPR